MKCDFCKRRRRAANLVCCRRCHEFIIRYIRSGLIPKRPVPIVADVLLVMRDLGVSQIRAVELLGGMPE